MLRVLWEFIQRLTLRIQRQGMAAMLWFCAIEEWSILTQLWFLCNIVLYKEEWRVLW